MELQPVESSMLSHIGYDPESLNLFVRFNPSKKQQAAGVMLGDLWAYKNVIPERWAEAKAVVASPDGSIGKWFLANVKGKFDGAVVAPEEFGKDYYESLIDDEEAGLV